jgi:hypothetical protein
VDRDPVHGGRHGVLADAVMDVAPPNAPGAISTAALVRVLLEGVRSAEPRTSSGITGVIASRASSLALRVAIFSGFARRARLQGRDGRGQRLRQLAMHPARELRFPVGASASTRSVHASRSAAPRPPASRQADRMGCGTSKGAAVQPIAAFAPASSSPPNGSPCAFDVPAFFGAPKPIVVRQAMRLGRSEACARSRAAAIASGSWPSIRSARQPAASNRFGWSTESASESGPSIEIPLSSKRTTRR